MKRKLSVLFLVGSILVLSINSIAFADDATKKDSEPKAEKPKLKIEDIKCEGKIIKSDENYLLMKNRVGIVLPKPKEKDSKINLEEWVGKTVVVSGKGSILKYTKEGKELEQITFESIESIKLPDPKEEDKNEKKPEEKK